MLSLGSWLMGRSTEVPPEVPSAVIIEPGAGADGPDPDDIKEAWLVVVEGEQRHPFWIFAPRPSFWGLACGGSWTAHVASHCRAVPSAVPLGASRPDGCSSDLETIGYVTNASLNMTQPHNTIQNPDLASVRTIELGDVLQQRVRNRPKLARCPPSPSLPARSPQELCLLFWRKNNKASGDAPPTASELRLFALIGHLRHQSGAYLCMISAPGCSPGGVYDEPSCLVAPAPPPNRAKSEPSLKLSTFLSPPCPRAPHSPVAPRRWDATEDMLIENPLETPENPTTAKTWAKIARPTYAEAFRMARKTSTWVPPDCDATHGSTGIWTPVAATLELGTLSSVRSAAEARYGAGKVRLPPTPERTYESICPLLIDLLSAQPDLLRVHPRRCHPIPVVRNNGRGGVLRPFAGSGLRALDFAISFCPLLTRRPMDLSLPSSLRGIRTPGAPTRGS